MCALILFPSSGTSYVRVNINTAPLAANTGRWTNVGLILTLRPRRWTNIKRKTYQRERESARDNDQTHYFIIAGFRAVSPASIQTWNHPESTFVSPREAFKLEVEVNAYCG